MNGFGNKAWRRAGLTVPDTRTELRIEVVGALKHKEWRKETPLRVTRPLRYMYANMLHDSSLARAESFERRTGQQVETFGGDNNPNEWVSQVYCMCDACCFLLTEEEARALFPEAFPVRYFVGLPHGELCRFLDGTMYMFNAAHMWRESIMTIEGMAVIGVREGWSREVSEQEARASHPLAFA